MGKKQVADAVLLVEADQKMAISHWNIAWHGGLPLGGLLWRLLLSEYHKSEQEHN
jgi:hypothetical protein